jgi:hypothetical protein
MGAVAPKPVFLFTTEAGTLRLCYHAGIDSADADMVCLTFSAPVKGAGAGLAAHLRCALRLCGQVLSTIAALLPEAGAAGLVGHGCLTALHQDLSLGAFLVRIIHTVAGIAV